MKNILKKTFKKIIIKIIKYFSIWFFIILLTLFTIDLTDFDTKYHNRGIINIDVKNLNSIHSMKLSNYLRLIYLRTYEFINRDSYNKRWGVENFKDRINLPNEILIPGKSNNFSKSIYEINEYETSNNWYRSHGNNFSTRFSSHSLINNLNATNMSLAWVYEPKSEKNYVYNVQANPIFFDGIIFTPNSQNQIIALNSENGKEIWSFDVIGGIAAKRGLIIFDPKKNKSLPTIIAQKEYRPRLYFTNNRKKLFCLDANTGKLITSFGKNGVINSGLTAIPPLIYKNNLIVIDTQSRMKVFDLFTGKINWKFDINEESKSILFSNFFKGSPWGGFSLDKIRGLMFFTTGNPEHWNVGVDRPGNNLYANSVVAFDLNEKKIRWHFQEIAHDLWNMDIAATPILTTVSKDKKIIDVVVAVTKLGNTLILDRETGESLFDIKKIKAPISNVPGEKTSPYQLSIDLPEAICRNKISLEDLSDLPYVKKDRLKKIFYDSEKGFPSPPKIGINTIQMAGCVRWSGATIDTKKNILYVNTDQQPTLVSIIKSPHWPGTYTHKWKKFKDEKNYPAIKPPWGSIVSLDLNTGKILWRIPFGEWEDLSKLNIDKTGTFNRSGITASRGNLIFASGTQDNQFTVINSLSGAELWKYKMSHPGSAPPLIYTYNEKQYVIIPAFEKGGKKIYAFTLN